MRRPFGKRLQRLAYRARDLVIADLPGRARARLVVKPIHAVRGKAIAPCAGRRCTDADLGGNRFVVEPARRRENNPRSFRQCLRGSMLARQCSQLASLRIIEYDRYRSTFRHSRPLSQGHENVTDLSIRTLEPISKSRMGVDPL